MLLPSVPPIITNILFQSSGNLYFISPSRSSISNLPTLISPRLLQDGQGQSGQTSMLFRDIQSYYKDNKSGVNLIEIYRYNLNNNFFSSSTI